MRSHLLRLFSLFPVLSAPIIEQSSDSHIELARSEQAPNTRRTLKERPFSQLSASRWSNPRSKGSTVLCVMLLFDDVSRGMLGRKCEHLFVNFPLWGP